MDSQAGRVAVHVVEHGVGRALLVLHGAGVDHREPEACFEPVFEDVAGFRRIYPDLPGMGRTPAPDELRSAEDVLDALLDFTHEVTGGAPYLLVGHSAGAYYAQAMAARQPEQIAGLALVCPLLPDVRDVPEHRVLVGTGDLGDEPFRRYFVVQTPDMLDRYERYVRPGAALVDQDALERVGERWELPSEEGPAYPGPMLVVAGRLDSLVGYAAAVDLLGPYPHASLAVVDDAGHALPHERPDVLRALVTEWLARVERPEGGRGDDLLPSDRLRKASFVDADLRAARFVRADLSGAVMRGVDVAGADIEAPWLFDEDSSVLVNGVDVVPLVDAELNRRSPGRAERRAMDPDGLRAAWAALERSWATTSARVAAMPEGTVEVSVGGEWSFAQTLRHLVMATDTWLGRGILELAQPYHPLGQPNAEYETDGYDLSVFTSTPPSYDEVLQARAGRVAMVRDFLATVTADDLTVVRRNPWAPEQDVTTLACLHVILNEEWEHHRYAVRDLDAIEATSGA